MSFSDAGMSRFSWASPAQPLPISARPEQGCAQCGSRLDPVEFGKFNFSGKCFNCLGWVSEDDGVFEDV
jgi:hypothetical protein